LIPVEKLLAVQTIVVHGNCPDGLASAVILDDVLPRREIIFATHKVTPLEAKPNMLFCDFCPPEEQAEAFRQVGAIVLDHHKGYQGKQEAITRSFEHHAFGDEKEDPGVSGAVLAYKHVWWPLFRKQESPSLYDPQTVAKFARLAGIRDTWLQTHEDWQTSCIQAEMLMFYPLHYWIDPQDPPYMLRPVAASMLEARMKMAGMVFQKKLDGSKQLAEKALYFTSKKGVKVAMLATRQVSDAAEQGQPKMLLSTRARNGYNCAAFCQFFGGGGHTSAAGCLVNLADSDLNPYAKIQSMMELFESSG
jgi:nanoRNase/pAp phosphatase (c-di-AMP/oligoRNAs hydrolase)